jgi:predicted RNase H-like HicB family nuclease
MQQARYEILEEDRTFYGEIPNFDGVYGNAETLEKCREELEEVLEEWLFFRISRNLDVPKAGSIELRIKKVS